MSRTIIIGLDGVPYELVKDLSGKGIMPNAGKIISNGIFQKIKSTAPEVSSVAWSSVITGANPAEHGIFGFTDIMPPEYKMCFPDFSNLKESPFWDRSDIRSTIINVPGTYPVRKMNGVHISGFVSIDLLKSVYPKSLVAKLNEFGYRLDVDSEIAHKSMDLFLEDLEESHKALVETYDYLWKESDWDVFMLVFTGTDRLMHFLFKAYADKNDKYHNNFIDHFKEVDDELGKILGKMKEDDVLLILSDHGFREAQQSIYINFILEEEGFLGFKGSEKTLGDIDSKTRAFALDPARIYINYKGKYRCGSVDEKDQGKVIKELIEVFKGKTIDGSKVIRNIYRKEEIYKGPLLDSAPDLILTANDGFDLKASMGSTVASGETIFTGCHTRDNAFLLAMGLDETAVSGVGDVEEVGKLIKLLTNKREA